jgi:hypothetical protein
MLGTLIGEQKKGIATDLYSFLVNHVLSQKSEYVGVTDSDNHAMLRIFQKLQGNRCDIQTTWSFFENQ